MEAIDRKLEAKISLAKGWYRQRPKEEMKAGIRRLAALSVTRRSEPIKETEREIFGGAV